MRRRLRRWGSDRRLPRARAELGIDPECVPQRFVVRNFTNVFGVTKDGHPAVLKIAEPGVASSDLKCHATTIEWVRSQVDKDTRDLIPRILGTTEVDMRMVTLETMLSGHTVRIIAPDPAHARAAMAGIRRVHDATAVDDTADASFIRQWVEHPVADLVEIADDHDMQEALRKLGRRLGTALLGRPITTSLVHGDFSPANVLVEDTDDGTCLTGIVDWELASRRGLPDCDLLRWHILSSASGHTPAARAACTAPEALSEELATLQVCLPNSHLSLPFLTTLTWLSLMSRATSHLRLENTRRSRMRQWTNQHLAPMLELID